MREWSNIFRYIRPQKFSDVIAKGQTIPKIRRLENDTWIMIPENQKRKIIKEYRDNDKPTEYTNINEKLTIVK